MKTLYKFLRTDLKSKHGDCKWKIGEWKKEKDVSICNRGFHASKLPRQALSYVGGEIIAKVEVKGKSVKQEDKQAWSEMRIVKAWNWTKKDSVEFSIFSARLVLDIFEKEYPDDDRPRKAIEAAENYIKALKTGNKKEIDHATYASNAASNAAYAATYDNAASNAAYAATYASNAASNAAYAATYASNAASNATYAAAYAANAAYNAAYAATYASNAAYAAKKSLFKKLDDWFIKRIKTLEVYDK